MMHSPDGKITCARLWAEAAEANVNSIAGSRGDHRHRR